MAMSVHGSIEEYGDECEGDDYVPLVRLCFPLPSHLEILGEKKETPEPYGFSETFYGPCGLDLDIKRNKRAALASRRHGVKRARARDRSKQ